MNIDLIEIGRKRPWQQNINYFVTENLSSMISIPIALVDYWWELLSSVLYQTCKSNSGYNKEMGRKGTERKI